MSLNYKEYEGILEEFLTNIEKKSSILVVGEDISDSLKKLGFNNIYFRNTDSFLIEPLPENSFDMVIISDMPKDKEKSSKISEKADQTSKKYILGILHSEAKEPDLRKLILQKNLCIWILKEEKKQLGSLIRHIFLLQKSSMNPENSFIIETFPRVIRIEPSSLCNLKCLHCPTGTIDMPRGIMDWELFEKIVQEIKELKQIKVAVLYHGGEPLLNKNLPKMIIKLKETGIEKIKMDTNGMLLTEELCEELIKSGIDTLFISLDGDCPEINDKIRRNSDYKKVIENIKLLCNKKKDLAFKTPDINICTIQFPTREEFEKNKLESPAWIVNEFKDFDVKILPYFAYLWPEMNIDNNIFEVFESEGEIKNYCDHIVNTITIRYDGTVVPCCYDLTNKYPIGNIKNSSLKELWNNEKYVKLRESIYKRKLFPLCKKCYVINPRAALSLKSVN